MEKIDFLIEQKREIIKQNKTRRKVAYIVG